jgi:hypothetical protein
MMVSPSLHRTGGGCCGDGLHAGAGRCPAGRFKPLGHGGHGLWKFVEVEGQIYIKTWEYVYIYIYVYIYTYIHM